MKVRLDSLLVERNLVSGRDKAKAYIMAGIVFMDGIIMDKPGTMVDPAAEISIKKSICPYVSRGGLKLEKAIEVFDIDLEGKIAVDMGASTGGFTDCMLISGAKKVYAVDVGYGQLAYKLRQDPRVVCIEKTNIRYLKDSSITDKPDFISIDVSFISLKLILPVAARLLNKEGDLICLVKPQFEAGRQQVGKKGIVREPAVHVEVLEKVIEYGKSVGFFVKNMSHSPVTGTKGNIEYLLYFNKNFDTINTCLSVTEVVKNAHQQLQ